MRYVSPLALISIFRVIDRTKAIMYFSTSISENAQGYFSKRNETPKYGLLIGIEGSDNSMLIFNAILVSEPIDTDWIDAIQQRLPGNFSILGLAIFNQSIDQSIGKQSIKSDLADWLGNTCQRLNLDGLSIVWLNFDELAADRLDFEKSIGRQRWYDSESKRLENENDDEGVFWKRHSEMASKLVTVRLRLSIPWQLKYTESWSKEEIEREIRRYFENRLENLLIDKSYFVGFRSGDNLISMINICDDPMVCRSIGSISEKATLLELFGRISGISKRKELYFHQDVIDCFTMEKMTQTVARNGESELDNEMNIVPVVQYEAGDFLYLNIPQNFELTIICRQDDKLSDLPSAILETWRRSAQLRLKQLLKYADLKKLRVCNLEPYVFLPTQCGHYVTNYFPAGFDDAKLEQERRDLHTLLSLSADRPLFRKSNRFYFPQERGPYLIDIHESVGDAGIGATMMGMVSGHYQYRHYMQDNIDDKNWGCAYRSFQTIWSWFLLNGYTSKAVPSHKEIQQALVDIGDKQPNFVGSRLWVGSLELSYCLSHLADVTSKILSVNSGDEIGQKSRELIHHFRTQGTPVMIGGGVLAHTILGVAYNEDTGESKCLILDPHYTGDENLKTIIDKGWCEWKAVSFWDKTAFYNMMMPIRPDAF